MHRQLLKDDVYQISVLEQNGVLCTLESSDCRVFCGLTEEGSCVSYEQGGAQKHGRSDDLAAVENTNTSADVGKVLSPRENRQNTDCSSPQQIKIKQKGILSHE